jgi:hypothetical protein
VLDAGTEPEAVRSLIERYEPYRARPPSGPLLMLEPERLLWWRAAGDA